MKKRIKSPYCTNCGKELPYSENFCPNCGQENDNKRQSFGRVMSDLIQGFLSVDSRLMLSIPALLFRPGFLTAEYLKGRRQTYLDPIRMFITIVVLYFLLASFGDDMVINDEGILFNDTTSQAADSNLIFKEGPFKLKVDDDDRLITVNDTLKAVHGDSGASEFQKIRFLVAQGIIQTDAIMDSLQVADTFWNRFYYGEIVKFIRSDKKEFRDSLIAKLPWIIFFIIPFFALLLKILYVRKKLFYIDHLIFAFHLHSFLFLTGIFYILILRVTDVELTGWLLFAAVIYTFLALKFFYKQGWFKTLFKYFLLTLLYAITALFCFMISAAVVFIVF